MTAWRRQSGGIGRRHLKFSWHQGNGHIPSFGIFVVNATFMIPCLHDILLFHQSRDQQAPRRGDVAGLVGMVLLPSDEIELNGNASLEVFICRDLTY